MRKRVLIYFLLIVAFLWGASANGLGQVVQTDSITILDSNMHVNLKEVKIKARKKKRRKHYRSTKKYWRTVRNLRLVYPYAEMANSTISQLNIELESVTSKRERRKLIRKEYKGLMRAYKKPMMKLKISQGKLLMKLIDRETGSSSYYHLKELKGSTTAFFWQAVASMFGTSLKSKYKPEGRDWMIEEILERMKKGELRPPRRIPIRLEKEDKPGKR